MQRPAWSATARTGPVRKYKELEVFACEGLLCVMDDRPGLQGTSTVVTPADMEERMAAVERSIKYRNRNDAEEALWRREERRQIRNGLSNLEECIKEARSMGDPTDPAVQAWWKRHRRNSTITFADPITLPDLPMGRFTGRTADADGPVTAAVNVPFIHKPAQRKNRSGIVIPSITEL